MSEKSKYPIAKARLVADELLELLKPYTHRIEIAGSIRREKPFVSDVELLFIPKFSQKSYGLFDTVEVNDADACLDELLSLDAIRKRPNVNGSVTWGSLNKLAVHTKSGIPVDFFSTNHDNWWVSLVIRTGSKETNIALTGGANRRGGSLLAYGCGFKDADSITHPATSEKHVFELCGVPFKEPKFR